MIKEEAVKIVSTKLNLTVIEALKLIDKAISGGEINENFPLDTWLNKRLLPNIIFINETDYARMCIDALKILSKTAATDYGGSRQRDLGQLWADMTRGYLGELAIKKYLELNWHIQTNLGHEVGNISDYLPMDIHQVKEPSGEYHAPKLKISVKTTKINGIWLDIPGDQFNHSDIHILVKVATGRDHLFAFFKALSVFKDKVLKKGEELGALTTKESNDLYDHLPTFRSIPAYVCGFVKKDMKYTALSYNGKLGRKNYTINSWNGPINAGDLDLIKRKLGIKGKISFEGIGQFAHDNGYLFNTGKLFWSRDEWDNIALAL